MKLGPSEIDGRSAKLWPQRARVATGTFEHTLESLLKSARRSDARSSLLQGLEFADERGWLDDVDARRLAAARAEEKIEREAFAKARYLMANAWRDEWRQWLEALCAELEAMADQHSTAALAALRAEAAGESTNTSLSWALCTADRLTTA